jgi:hypothetical protein
MGLIAMGFAGFLIGGTWTAFALMVSWSAIVTACWRLALRKVQARPQSGEKPSRSLGDIAGERGWDIEKRLEIAGMACEHRDMTFDELEKLYDRGVRSLLGENAQHRPD